ncbi:hypothetical protein F5D26_16725 [Burkholderia pseudomallei]|nr:hypothetical protein BUC_5793 [Burkholderia pseudomallei 576]KAA8767141.1 hypothetical protein F5D26_16725 [Burkholderia pseudomallei]
MRTRKRVGLSRARCNGRVRGGEARGGPDGGGIDRPGPPPDGPRTCTGGPRGAAGRSAPER